MILHSACCLNVWLRQAASATLLVACFAFLTSQSTNLASVLRLILLEALKELNLKSPFCLYDVEQYQLHFNPITRENTPVSILWRGEGRGFLAGHCGLPFL